ncbi:hypothetical protein J5N97_017196 [Dioscorea zingiberensis]|uniref:Pentatricopeptide repeat-containing protein n=1 Tax=Dioscorea zingiberensis TaxID=325984 RepID=A0A9D5CKQ2_9LILI|nr:hypothetical protein J5N97_017196 [Dioscorea zingiberensis]
MAGVPVGEQVHTQVLKMGFSSEVVIQTAVLKMYGMFGDLVSAQKVFDETSQRDMVQWNALVAVYAQRNHPYEAILVARTMVRGYVRPNEVTVVSITSACSQLKDLQQGKLLHAYAIKNLLGFDMILSNALIDMHGCHVCENGRVGLGNLVDEYVEKNGYTNSVYMANALIDMHGKCGNIEKACQIFKEMKVRTLVSWTSMIQGLALHGHGMEALVRFSQMQRKGFVPDKVVFLSVLNACNHAGLATEGIQCFKLMVEEHGMDPWMEHYGSMVDLLCKAGLLGNAFDFVGEYACQTRCCDMASTDQSF